MLKNTIDLLLFQSKHLYGFQKVIYEDVEGKKTFISQQRYFEVL